MPLSPDDIREIVARAEQLQREGDPSTDEAEALILAGEDLGISRSAMQRAVQERLGPQIRPEVGELLFARSADDNFYAAEVVAEVDRGYRIRFLRGGQQTVRVDELRACPFLPGDQVTCPWPGWGAWTGTVVSHDAEKGTLTVSDGWAETATFPVRDVWLTPRSAERQRRRRLYAVLLAAGAAAGAVIGSLLTALAL